MFKLPIVALVIMLCLLFNVKIRVDLIYFSFPSIIPTMQLSNQTFSHLTTHRNWQKQATHHAFLLAPKLHLTDLLKQCDILSCTLQKGHFFNRFVFHIVKNFYHKPGPPAAGHLIFADSAHSISLPHLSVKSREQTQSKVLLLQKTVCLFVIFLENNIW